LHIFLSLHMLPYSVPVCDTQKIIPRFHTTDLD
jgi:hypothetical protein